MTIFLQSQPTREQLILKALRTSNDISFIEKVIAQGNEYAKEYLLWNPNLSEDNLRALGKDTSFHVRRALAKRSDIPLDVLDALLADPDQEIRTYALCNPRTDFSYYKNAIMNGTFSLDDKDTICRSNKALESVEVFHYLWTTVKHSHVTLTHNLSWVDEDKNLKIDPECVHVIHDAIRSGKATNTLREAYAAASFALPEILDDLKDDKSRPVINAVARNKSAWVSTHEHLVASHKTPAIRISVAGATKDNTLLNKIYHNTKSKEIREAVERNPVFVNTKP